MKTTYSFVDMYMQGFIPMKFLERLIFVKTNRYYNIIFAQTNSESADYEYLGATPRRDGLEAGLEKVFKNEMVR